MYTSPELRLLYNDYFEIIRNTNDFIELKSRNTKHCWIIHKHKFGDNKKIYLYHKHSIENKYYHQHWKTYSVKMAVDRIKGHDKYVIEYASH